MDTITGHGLFFLVKAFAFSDAIEQLVHGCRFIIALIGQKAQLRRKFHINLTTKLAAQEG